MAVVRKAYFEMTIEELNYERGLIEGELRRRLIGDPSVSVHFGPDGVSLRKNGEAITQKDAQT